MNDRTHDQKEASACDNSLPFAAPSRPRPGAVLHCVLIAAAMAGSVWLQTGTAQASVTISPGMGPDDTNRIQQAIDSSTGAVHFEAGIYKLHGALHLRPNRSYIGQEIASAEKAGSSNKAAAKSQKSARGGAQATKDSPAKPKAAKKTTPAKSAPNKKATKGQASAEPREGKQDGRGGGVAGVSTCRRIAFC